jgi:hypothetical protein
VVTTTVFVRATDAHPSPQTSSPVSANYTVDESSVANAGPPVVSLVSPGATTTSEQVVLVVEADDPDGIAVVEASIDGGPWVEVPLAG